MPFACVKAPRHGPVCRTGLAPYPKTDIMIRWRRHSARNFQQPHQGVLLEYSSVPICTRLPANTGLEAFQEEIFTERWIYKLDGKMNYQPNQMKSPVAFANLRHDDTALAPAGSNGDISISNEIISTPRLSASCLQGNNSLYNKIRSWSQTGKINSDSNGNENPQDFIPDAVFILLYKSIIGKWTWTALSYNSHHGFIIDGGQKDCPKRNTSGTVPLVQIDRCYPRISA